MVTQPSPPPRTATSHDEIQAKMTRPVLWYQSKRQLDFERQSACSLARLTSKELIWELPLHPRGMVEQALALFRTVARPSELRSPARTRKRGIFGIGVFAASQLVSVGVCCHVKNAGFAGLGKIFVRAVAIVLVGYDGGALVAPASLQFFWNGLGACQQVSRLCCYSSQCCGADDELTSRA